MIPKHNMADNPADFRPISCCNVLYKIISGLLAARFKVVLPKLINVSQGAFVEGRSVVGNICIAQQLLAGYGTKNKSERLSWKIDLKKAYDSVNLDLLDAMLIQLQFPLKFISWISMCVRSTTFLVLLNGCLEGLNKKADFFQHPKCHKIGLKHIMFADDLILFSSSRQSSILAPNSVMENFFKVSGLDINVQKSQIFVSEMCEAKKAWVESILSTAVCPLPVRYLGDFA
ncbi:unnamed protein product [Rhodiola kirilowii]